VTNERRSIIAKIKKILARTKSPNEHEAAVATAMAQAELAKHNIDISEVESLDDSTDRKVGEDRFESINRPRHRTIRRACAKMYFCQYYYMRHGTKVINVYIGEPHNVEIAKLMSDYLIKTVWRLTKEACKVAYQPSGAYTNSFANACAGRVAERIYERIDQTKRATTVTEDNRNLPVLAPLYERAQRANAEFLRNQGVTFVISRSRQRFNSADGVAHGRRAGDTIGLDTQINGPGTKLLR
jgi:hypothetical protein